MVSQKIKNTIKLTSSLIIALLVFAPSLASAATLSIGASKVKVAPGQTFSANISVNTQGKTINNVEASISFPANLLEVSSISQGSVLSIWVEPPTFSNSSGTISFNGGSPNPGFSGSGTVATVQFRAKSAGVATVSFASAFVRENDGYGTNILSSRSGTSITIETSAPTPAPDSAPTPKPTSPTGSEQQSPLAPEQIPGPTQSIVVTEFTSLIKSGEVVRIVGTVPMPNAKLRVFFRSPSGAVWSYEQSSNSQNQFSFESEPIGKSGTYQVWIESNLPDGGVIKTPEMGFDVKMNFRELVQYRWNNFINWLTVERCLIILLALLACIGWYKYYKLKDIEIEPGSSKARKSKTRL